jgi:succinate dehydrogenase hydrophobic anchor subunit
MNETDVVIAARREVYRIVSWVILAINLLLLVVVGLALPLFYLPHQIRVYKDMGRMLPMITRFAIDFSTPVLCLLGTGLIGMLLVLKDFLAAPRVRFKINVVTLLLLLIWGVCYAFVIYLPMWGMMRAMQGS